MVMASAQESSKKGQTLLIDGIRFLSNRILEKLQQAEDQLHLALEHEDVPLQEIERDNDQDGKVQLNFDEDS